MKPPADRSPFSALRIHAVLLTTSLALLIALKVGDTRAEPSERDASGQDISPSAIDREPDRVMDELTPWAARRIFNIDFGPWIPNDEVSGQEGPAVVGLEKDFWNIVGIPWSNHHRVDRLSYASGDSSTIQVELKNLGGAWNSRGAMGVKSAMLDCYHYPMNNQGGNSEVILHQVYPGRYALYLYGHGAYDSYYGDYTVTVGEKNYGRQKTADAAEAVETTEWVEGLQYVRYPRIEVAQDETIRIVIQPGGEIVDPHGRRIRDAMICGLQLVPLD